MRLLLIATRRDYRLLVRKHVEIEWPDAVVVEHALGVDPALDQDFAAVGFDAVIIVAAPPTAVAANFALGQAGKREFAPIVLVLLEDAPDPLPAPAPGLHQLYGRKMDRERLLKLIKTASGEHRQALAMLRASPGFENRYRFGSV